MGVLQLFEADRRLNIRHRFPAFELAGGKVDTPLVNRPVLPRDHERLAGESLPGPPGEDSRLVRLVERDQWEPGRRIGMPGGAQHAHRRVDFLGRQRIERVRRRRINHQQQQRREQQRTPQRCPHGAAALAV